MPIEELERELEHLKNHPLLNAELRPLRQLELPLTPQRPGNKGPTFGIFCNNGNQIPLLSGRSGPAQQIPLGTPGFDACTRTHVEGHAAAIMRLSGINQGDLYLNNPIICPNYVRNLPTMLPPGGNLNIILPNGRSVVIIGR